MKYVVAKGVINGEEVELPFLFPMQINHNEFAALVPRMFYARMGDFHEIVSAGFYRGGRSSGRSETLNIKSRPEDTALIKGEPAPRQSVKEDE